MIIHCMSQQKTKIWEKNNLLNVLHQGVEESMSRLSIAIFTLKSKELSNITFLLVQTDAHNYKS